MLINHTLDQLRVLKLTGMTDAYQQQLEQPALHELSFDERFTLLVERETMHRENRRLTRLLQLAHLKQSACVEDIDYKHRRGLRSRASRRPRHLRLDTFASQPAHHRLDRLR